MVKVFSTKKALILTKCQRDCRKISEKSLNCILLAAVDQVHGPGSEEILAWIRIRKKRDPQHCGRGSTKRLASNEGAKILPTYCIPVIKFLTSQKPFLMMATSSSVILMFFPP
jgi:hypothetical protein